MEDRRDNKKEITAIYALAFAVMAQAAGIVWWGATLSTDVKHLSTQMNYLQSRIEYLERKS